MRRSFGTITLLILAIVTICGRAPQSSAQSRPSQAEPEDVAPPAVVARAGAGSPQLGQRRPRDPEEVRMERDRLKRMNKERHERLKSDTDKLLVLATELKQYVDRTNENTLSLDVLKKAEEIEKLARSVREKMKQDLSPAME